MSKRSPGPASSKISDGRAAAGKSSKLPVDAEGRQAIGPNKTITDNDERPRRPIHSNSPKERRATGQLGSRSSDITEVIASGIVSRIIAARKEDGNIMTSTRPGRDKTQEIESTYSPSPSNANLTSSIPAQPFSSNKVMEPPAGPNLDKGRISDTDTKSIKPEEEEGSVSKGSMEQCDLVAQITLGLERHAHRSGGNELERNKNASGVALETNQTSDFCSELSKSSTTTSQSGNIRHSINTPASVPTAERYLDMSKQEVLMESAPMKSMSVVCREEGGKSAFVGLSSVAGFGDLAKSNYSLAGEIGWDNKNSAMNQGRQQWNNKSNPEKGCDRPREVTQDNEMEEEMKQSVNSVTHGGAMEGKRKKKKKKKKKSGRNQDETRKGSDGKSSLPSSVSKDSGICSPTTDCKREVGGGGGDGGSEDSGDGEGEETNIHSIYNIAERAEESLHTRGIFPTTSVSLDKKGENSCHSGDKKNCSKLFTSSSVPCLSYNVTGTVYSGTHTPATTTGTSKMVVGNSNQCISPNSSSSTTTKTATSTFTPCSHPSASTTTTTAAFATITTTTTIITTTASSSFSSTPPTTSSDSNPHPHTPTTNLSSESYRDRANRTAPTPVSIERDTINTLTALLAASSACTELETSLPAPPGRCTLIPAIDAGPTSCSIASDRVIDVEPLAPSSAGEGSCELLTTDLDSNWSLGQPNLKPGVTDSDVEEEEGQRETDLLGADDHHNNPNVIRVLSELLQRGGIHCGRDTSGRDISGRLNTDSTNEDTHCKRGSCVDLERDQRIINAGDECEVGLCIQQIVVDIEAEGAELQHQHYHQHEQQQQKQEQRQPDVESAVESNQADIQPNECIGNPKDDVTLTLTNEQTGNSDGTPDPVIPKPPRKNRVCKFKNINIQDVISLDPERKLKGILKTKSSEDSPSISPVFDKEKGVVPTTSDVEEAGNKRRITSARTVSFKKTHIKNTFSYHNAAFEGEVITEPSRRPSLADVVSHIMRSNSMVEMEGVDEEDNYHPYGRDSSMTDLVYGSKRSGRYPIDAGKMIVWLALAIMIVSLAGGIIFMSENYNHKEGIVYTPPEETTTPSR